MRTSEDAAKFLASQFERKVARKDLYETFDNEKEVKEAIDAVVTDPESWDLEHSVEIVPSDQQDPQALDQPYWDESAIKFGENWAIDKNGKRVQLKFEDVKAEHLFHLDPDQFDVAIARAVLEDAKGNLYMWIQDLGD